MIRPASYINGMYPLIGQPRFSKLWHRRIRSWAPCLGPTGSTLCDWSGAKANTSLANMEVTDWVLSDGQYALNFSTNDYIDCGSPALGLDYTISAFVKPSSVSGNLVITSYRSTSNSTPILFQLDRNGADYRILYRNDAGNLAFAVASGTASTTTTTHVCATKKGTAITLYIDGIAAATATATAGACSVNSMNLGAIVAGSATRTAYWEGTIDDICLYDDSISATLVRLLAKRRGIANEVAPRRVSKNFVGGFRAYWAARKAQIIGGGF